MEKLISFVIALALVGLLASSGYGIIATPEWTAFYNGPGNGDDWPSTVEVDADGFIYVTGFSYGGIPGSEDDYVTIKYSPDGDTLWVQRYNGPGNWVDWASDIAVDSQGNVYVTGHSMGVASLYDYATIKYAPNGDLLWLQRYTAPGASNDYGEAICLDSSGNVIVTGSSSGGWSWDDCLTIKYNSAGAALWSQRYNGLGNRDDAGHNVKADASNNVYVSGTCAGPGEDSDYFVLKYNSSGDLLWAATYDGPGGGDDMAYAMDLDAFNNVYVAGSSIGVDDNDDIAVLTYTSSGVQQWIQRYNGPANGSDITGDLVVGPDQNAYLTGASEGISSYYDVVTIKYSRQGNQEWIQRYDGPGGHADRGYALALDSECNVYIGGSTNGIGTGADYLVIRYNPDGQLEWVANFNGAGNSQDFPCDIFVDANQNAFVTGYAFESQPTGFDFATIKYIQNPSLITVILTPSGTPIQIPPGGGSFNFNVQIINNQATPLTFNFWSMITLPGGSQYGPVLGPMTLTLSPEASIVRDRTQFIGALFPPGNYLYCSYVGTYQDSVWDSDSFPFAKLSSGSSDAQSEELIGVMPEMPAEYRLYDAYPNPFNPSTTIPFDLPLATEVQLGVYDVMGRPLTSLLHGWLEAGHHQAIFDGSNFAGGLYIYRLQAGEFSASGKVVLTK